MSEARHQEHAHPGRSRGSAKRAKTVTVPVRASRAKHEPCTARSIARSQKYHALATKRRLRWSDLAEIAEGRPISKTKELGRDLPVEKARLV